MQYGIHLASACKMTHAAALAQIQGVGIGIYSSGGCSNPNVGSCTSLQNINCNAIACLRQLKTSSGCPITVTGGTVRLSLIFIPLTLTDRAFLLSSRKLATLPDLNRMPTASRSIFRSTRASTRTSPVHSRSLATEVMALLNTKQPAATSTPRKATTGISPLSPRAKYFLDLLRNIRLSFLT